MEKDLLVFAEVANIAIWSTFIQGCMMFTSMTVGMMVFGHMYYDQEWQHTHVYGHEKATCLHELFHNSKEEVFFMHCNGFAIKDVNTFWPAVGIMRRKLNLKPT